MTKAKQPEAQEPQKAPEAQEPQEKKKREEEPRFTVSDNEYLTVKEAACYLGLALNYFYKLTADREIPFYCPTKRKMLFKRSELRDWIESTRVPSKAEIEATAAMCR